jgi:hypothetical protein
METDKSKYSHLEKVKALRVLEKNTFNYLKTARQTKISRPTLRKWERLYGKEVFKGKSPTEEALVEIDAEMKHNDINIIRHLYSLRKRTLQRVVVMAEKETKLESLLNVLKFVSGEIQKFSEIEKPEDEIAVDYIKIVTNAFIKSSKDQSQIIDQDY